MLLCGLWRRICLALSLVLLALAGVASAADYADPPLSAKDRNHWSFKKPEAFQPPKVHDQEWVRNPIDAFVLAKLEQAGLKPAPSASRLTLLRRITFDLTGLPPTPEEMQSFVSDQSPTAYEKLVDRLLASPRYGERWAQHWLDIARYADSNGYEIDADRPHAWRYRDYVVQAFNEDKPYDQFVREQLAGDLLARDKQGQEKTRLQIAAGFNRCGQIHLVVGNIDPEESRYEVLTEMTGAVGSAFLGLTLNCARCHDHKFDPVSQGDYFRLQAFFARAQLKDIEIASKEEKNHDEQRRKELEGPLARVQKQIADIEAPYRARLEEMKKAAVEPVIREALSVDPKKRTPEQKKLIEQAEPLLKVSWDEVLDALKPLDRERRARLRMEFHQLEAKLPPPLPQAWTIEDGASAPTFLLKRGSLKNKGLKVAPAFPRVLVKEDKPHQDSPEKQLKSRNSFLPFAMDSRSLWAAFGNMSKAPNRLDLANWLVDPEHPLTSRVMVNRLWQHHFGKALVRTPNDFGLRGEKPTHPELLEWLAREFIEHKWSMKHMHRLMVLSNAYQQASGTPKATRKADPQNRLLSHMNRSRLEGETIRDSMLAATGELNLELGGIPVRTPLEPEVYDLIFTESEPDNLWPVDPDPRQHARRSIYLFVKRNVHLPLLETFDQPDTLSSCPVRPTSTFAPQALIMLNGPFAKERANQFALRLLKEKSENVEDWLRTAYRLAVGRMATEAELAAAKEFLTNQSDLLRDLLRSRHKIATPQPLPDTIDPAQAAALADFCLALLNSNEFVYVD
jgi:hypothetical protein